MDRPPPVVGSSTWLPERDLIAVVTRVGEYGLPNFYELAVRGEPIARYGTLNDARRGAELEVGEPLREAADHGGPPLRCWRWSHAVAGTMATLSGRNSRASTKAGSTPRNYATAYMVCGAVLRGEATHENIAAEPASQPTAFAQKHAAGYREPTRQAPFDGCLDALEGRPENPPG